MLSSFSVVIGKGVMVRSCACVLLAIVLMAAAAGIYLAVQFLDDGKKTERVYKGSFEVSDQYSPSLTDALSEIFQEKAGFYKTKLDSIFNNSTYKTVFLQSEILAFNKKEDNLVVHFNLHVASERLSAADLYVVLAKYVDNVSIQERRAGGSNELDRWLPRRHYPGQVSGLREQDEPRCLPAELPFCPGNGTLFPNPAGHPSPDALGADADAFRQTLDLECYSLARHFVCQLLLPPCQHPWPPCRDFCLDFWRSCRDMLPKEVSKYLNCTKFPEFSGNGTCHPHPDSVASENTTTLETTTDMTGINR